MNDKAVNHDSKDYRYDISGPKKVHNIKEDIEFEVHAVPTEEGKTEPIKLDEKEEKKANERKENLEKMRQTILSTRQSSIQDGNYVYELYCVMVHAGGAYGGHYYSYIKPFNQWFLFNDSIVAPADEINVACTFGCMKSYTVGAETRQLESVATAYLLLYRKIDTNWNVPILPDYMKAELDKENQSFLLEEQSKKESLLNIKLRVYFNKAAKYVTIKKTQTLNGLKLKAIECFEIKSQLCDCRIRSYSARFHSFLEAYTGKEECVYNYIDS